MAKKAAVRVDDDAIVWEEFTSAKGKKFEVGHLDESGAANQNGSARKRDKKDFGIAVNWPVGPDTWINMDAAFIAITAITRYKLHSNAAASDGNVGGYAYRLDFSNEEHYDYTFYDETGDSYGCNTFSNTDHFVRYNSDKPTIAYIKGS